MDRFDIKGEKHARAVVDDFLAAPKSLVGAASWACDIDSEECRTGWLLAVDGIPTRHRLDVSAFPMDEAHSFTITLNFPPCVTRLDFVGPNEGHQNPLEEYARWDLIVFGPHIHLWEDNRKFCTAASLPKELEVALALPANIKRYEQAMFYFCDLVNITMTSGDLMPLPPRGRLV